MKMETRREEEEEEEVQVFNLWLVVILITFFHKVGDFCWKVDLGHQKLTDSRHFRVRWVSFFK